MAMPFFGIYLLEARGVGLAETGAVYFAAGVLGLASQLVGGRLTDALGPKKVMLIGYGFSLASSIVLGYMILADASPYLFFVVYPSFRFLRGFTNPATASIIAGHPASQIRPGYNLLSIGGNLGFAIGPALGGPVADLFGYSTVFFVSAALVVPVIALAFLYISGGVRYSPEERKEGTKRSISWKRDRNLVYFLALTGCLYMAVGYEIAPLSLYVADFLSFTNTEIGYVFATNGLVIVLLQFPLISLVGRAKNIAFPLMVSPLLLAASFVMAANSTGFYQFEAVMVVLTLGEILLTVPSQTVIALFSRAGNRGTYQGYFYAASNTGRSTAAAVGTLSFEVFLFDPALGWYAIAAFAVATFFGFVLVGPRIQRDYESRDLTDRAAGVGDASRLPHAAGPGA